MAGTRTIGTTLVKTMSGTETVDLTIANLTKIGEIGLESDEIDTTTLDSPEEFKEFIAGSKDAGTIDLEGNLVSESAAAALLALANSRSIEEYTVSYPSGATWVFNAFVKTFKDGEKTPDGLATFKSSLRVSGAPVYTPAA